MLWSHALAGLAFAALVPGARTLKLPGVHSTAMVRAHFSAHESAPDTNPDSPFWRGAAAISYNTDTDDHPASKRESTVLSRWTHHNLYFLFICPYQQLHLKPNPNTHVKTNGLWNWDVAEVFIGSDFQDINLYHEFEISPQGEWLDVAVNLNHPNDIGDFTWNSGLQASARIDPEHKVWYGFLRIPYSAVDARPAAAANKLRINFFRCWGEEPHRTLLAWRPTMKPSFHVPEAFGLLELAP